MAQDNDLERKAVEELLQEACRGRERAQTMGPAGWMKCPLRGTNKRFLHNTLRTVTLQGHQTAPARTDRSGMRAWEVKSTAHVHRSREARHSEPRGHAPSASHGRGRSRSPVKRSDSGSAPSSSAPKMPRSVQAKPAHYLRSELQKERHKDCRK